MKQVFLLQTSSFFCRRNDLRIFLKSDIITVTYHKKSLLKDISPLVDTRRRLNNRKIFLWSPGLYEYFSCEHCDPQDIGVFISVFCFNHYLSTNLLMSFSFSHINITYSTKSPQNTQLFLRALIAALFSGALVPWSYWDYFQQSLSQNFWNLGLLTSPR